jgi:hypothetical protein
MSVTVQEVLNIFYSLADLLDDNGNITSSDAAPYENKTPSILNILQGELIKQGDLFKTYEISNTPITNMFGMTFDDLKEYDGVNELILECEGAAKAYSIDVDSECTIYIEDYTTNWNTLATINVPSTVNDFDNYNGVITPTTGATKTRYRITGSYFARVNNYAFFEYPLQASKVPVYRKWVKKSMPSDFKSIDQIINEESQNYYNNPNFKWEGKSDLYVDYDYSGSIRIVYHPVPVRITSLTDTLQVDDVTAITILPYGLAAHLLLEENDTMAAFYQSRYEELRNISSIKQPTSESQIVDMYNSTM